jgi:hypothetical protein
VDENGNKTPDLVHMLYLPPVQLQCAADESSAAPGSFPLVLIIHGGPQVGLCEEVLLISWHIQATSAALIQLN